MSTLIMWYNRFSKNENKAVEAHIPQHQDSKTKKPRLRDSGTKTPWHRETEKNKPQHRNFKTKNHNIEIPRPKCHNIEFLWNPDPYAPWYLWLVRCFQFQGIYDLENGTWRWKFEFSFCFAIVYFADLKTIYFVSCLCFSCKLF